MIPEQITRLSRNKSEYERLPSAHAIVRCILEQGIEYVFGVPGGQVLSIVDALYEHKGVTFVAARHECSAASMADGYARVTGRPGICLATTGPGATNLLTGIGGAMRDSVPVIAITGNNRRRDLNRDDAQSADHVNIFKSLVKKSTLVTDPSIVTEVMRDAFRSALSGCPGPVHLDFTRDVLEEGYCNYLPYQPDEVMVPPGASGQKIEIARALTFLLEEAKRPIIWAGRGVTSANAGSELITIAEYIKAPVITTYNGISSVPGDHPLVFGPKSRCGTRLSDSIISESDALLVVGNSLNAVSTSRWELELPKDLVHIDIDPSAIGRYYPCRIGIVGDAKQTLSLMCTSLTQKPYSPYASMRDDWVAKLEERRTEWIAQINDACYSTHVPIKPQFVMAALRKWLPRDAIVAFDAGNVGVWSHLMSFYEPRSYMKPVGYGNMAFALPAGIGAKLAFPDKAVAVVIGDGSLGMCLAELETVARSGVELTIIVMNDLAYGNIKQEQLVKYGPRYCGVDFTDIKFADVAEAMGIHGVRVNSPAEFLQALELSRTHKGSFLIDTMIDTEDNVWLLPF